MPLIGRQFIYGSNFKLDNISSQFNGITATFNITLSGRPFKPGSSYGLLVSLSGVIQEPNISYTISDDQITFSVAPLSTDTFFGYILGSEITVGVPGDRVITGEKLSDPFNYESGLLYLDSANRRVGINTSSPTSTLHVVGDARIAGILTVGTGSITINGSTDTISGVSSVTDNSGGYLTIPPGAIQFFASNTAPNGWIKANGASISRSTYAALFANIGTVFGAGNGSTTFGIPDLRGEFPRGWDDARGIDSGRAFGTAQAQDWKGFSQTNTGQNTLSYSHGPVDMGKNTASFVGNLFVGSWAAPAAAMGTRWNAADEVRPRNIALLACIKY
jgi:microcystin-dependent protein